MSYATRQDLADKINWEGDLDEFILNYGCRLDDLPEGDTELRAAVAAALAAAKPYEEARDALQAMLGDLLD